MRRQPNPGAIDFSDILSSDVVTEDDMERRLTAMALRVIESRFLDGTASSQETTTLARHNSTTEKLQQKKLQKEIELLEVKKRFIIQQEQNDRLFSEAIEAMRSYRPGQTYEQPQDIHFLKEENVPRTM